jgi:uncharacterized tellurite resistance protein B-like protein
MNELQKAYNILSKKKTRDEFKTMKEIAQDLLKAYNKAINDLLIELLERAVYPDVCFYKYENGKLKDCETEDGTEFQAGDGSDDGETITGYWVGEDIGGILVINEEWSIKPEILKQAVELKTANIEDVFDYYDYEYEETEKKRSVLTFKNWYKLNCK